jgi:hypothetical protein
MTTGHHKVHGVHEEETALGYQLICRPCESQYLHLKGGDGDEEGMISTYAKVHPPKRSKRFWMDMHIIAKRLVSQSLYWSPLTIAARFKT